MPPLPPRGMMIESALMTVVRGQPPACTLSRAGINCQPVVRVVDLLRMRSPLKNGLKVAASAAGSDVVSRRRGSRLISGVSGIYRRGTASYTNLSIYAFGLSALWTGVGSAILPFKVLDLTAAGPVLFLGFELGKNGVLGLLALMGGITSAAVQPVAGMLSDRAGRSQGKRIPFLAIGGIGLLLVTFAVAPAATLPALLLVIVIMQAMGNFGQGPANALILDHVPQGRVGAAAGALNLSRVAGAGILTVIVLRLMGNYDAETGRQWLWMSLALLSGVMLITTLWSVITLRPRRTAVPDRLSPTIDTAGVGAGRPASAGMAGPDYTQESESPTSQTPPAALLLPVPAQLRDGANGASAPDRRCVRAPEFVLFLVSLTVIVGAMSAMQMYALFFLQDVVKVENPANSAALMVIVVGVSAAATVLPAGSMSDRAGRWRLLVIAGLLGAAGSLIFLFARSMEIVLLNSVVIGVSVGIFISVTWAVANDMVPKTQAARNLGFTSFAFLTGAGAARAAGFGIDALNNHSENLGYYLLLLVIAAGFALAPLMLASITGKNGFDRGNGTRHDSLV